MKFLNHFMDKILNCVFLNVLPELLITKNEIYAKKKLIARDKISAPSINLKCTSLHYIDHYLRSKSLKETLYCSNSRQ